MFPVGRAPEHVGQKTANFTAARNDLFTVKIFSTLAKNKIPGPLRRKSYKKNVKDEENEQGRKEKQENKQNKGAVWQELLRSV
jgi:hypothetical protein